MEQGGGGGGLLVWCLWVGLNEFMEFGGIGGLKCVFGSFAAGVG
jgi:hypothetical protein